MAKPTTRAERNAARPRRSILTPAFRRWAYGVTIAAIPVTVALGWLSAEALAILAPLAMALFYVDKTGEPK